MNREEFRTCKQCGKQVRRTVIFLLTDTERVLVVLIEDDNG